MTAFRVERDGGALTFRFPPGAYDEAQLDALMADGGGIAMTRDGESLRITSHGGDAGAAANRLFARLNGYPSPDPALLDTFRNDDAPLVSCILLLPFNDLFARNAILPGIIASSRKHPIEIIIVDAGFGTHVEPLRHLRIVQSELTSIARGYNNGVRAARGEYVALFHDDCFIDDPLWIEKSLAALTGNVGAVTPELDDWYGEVPVGKAVPLVMRRRTYLDLGGYDEMYYAGVEDMDLTCNLMAHGLEMRKIDIHYRHLRGMGTSLTVHPEPLQLRRLFGFQVLPADVIRRVHADSMQRLLGHAFVRLLEARYHLHFLDKFESLLRDRFNVDVPARRDFYTRMLWSYVRDADFTVIEDRARLVDSYRNMMNVEELTTPA